jgi:hypothetical protein
MFASSEQPKIIIYLCNQLPEWQPIKDWQEEQKQRCRRAEEHKRNKRLKAQRFSLPLQCGARRLSTKPIFTSGGCYDRVKVRLETRGSADMACKRQTGSTRLLSFYAGHTP